MADKTPGEVDAQMSSTLPPPPPACVGGTLHTVTTGETLTSIAASFGISLQALVAANPQLISVGQVLCVPVSGPCCLVLQPTSDAPATAGGTAWVSQTPPSTVTTLVAGINLPPPQGFGPFTTYFARFVPPTGASFQFALSPASGQPIPVAAGGATVVAGPLSPATTVLVFPGNLTGGVGPVLLQGTLANGHT